jgi:S1-C subfamily serine protease
MVSMSQAPGWGRRGSWTFRTGSGIVGRRRGRSRRAGLRHASAQYNLAGMYWRGEGVPTNHVLAYAWASLAAAGGHEDSRKRREWLAKEMTREQIAEAQRIAAAFKPKVWQPRDQGQQPESRPATVDAMGSGFFITTDGYFITNHHVVADATRVRVRTAAGTFPATVVRTDVTNDLAILKVQGDFSALPVRGSRGLRLADRVSTLGYPNPDLQGLAAKHSSGEIAALSGPGDDPRFLQISVPIQRGNSGGPLVDAAGCVVGVIVAQLDKMVTLKMTGSLPENVNYAIKGTILLGVLEAVPGLADKVRSEHAKPPADAAEAARLVEAACGMVLVER